MNRTKRIIATVTTSLAMFGFTFNFIGCSKESTIGPTLEENPVVVSLGKKKVTTIVNDKSENWVKEGSKTFKFSPVLDYYKGGNIRINGTETKFNFEDNSLTPPPDTPFGEPVTITMKMEYKSVANELIFTFGPHGCKFKPDARVKLDYATLGIDVAQLYYIEDDGTRTLQAPEQIDINKKFMMIKIDHFSRYALAHSE